jgi:lipopolysaccharide transport system permease protein
VKTDVEARTDVTAIQAAAGDSAGPRSEARQRGAARVVRVQAGKGWAAGPREVWEHREVLYFLLLRNLKARYRQTVLGAAWAVLQPLALMGVFVIFLEKLIGVPSEGIPYPIFAFAALVPWGLASSSVTVAAESVVRDMNLVSKVYVPRLLIPFAAVGALLVDFLIALGILFVLMTLYSISPEPTALFVVPALTLLALALALAVGVWLSALMVMYRDVRSAVPFLAQLWLFATPVAYPSSLVPDEWQTVYALNPMVGVVEGFRWALLGTPAPDSGMLAISGVMTVLLLGGAFTYFRRVDRIFADVI